MLEDHGVHFDDRLMGRVASAVSLVRASLDEVIFQEHERFVFFLADGRWAAQPLDQTGYRPKHRETEYDDENVSLEEIPVELSKGKLKMQFEALKEVLLGLGCLKRCLKEIYGLLALHSCNECLFYF